MKPIPGFPGYQITTDGRVWSESRKYSRIERWLKPCIERGYLQVYLNKNGKSYRRRIHQLVLETYIGPCPEGMECRHLNGNSQDNKLENLKWGTPKENVQDAVRHGTHNCLRLGGQHTSSKLTEQNVRMIIYMYRTGLFTQQEIADSYNTCQTNIQGILSKRTWKHLWKD
jgi:hypothetical protein